MRRFESLVLFLLVVSFALILLGGYVRASEAGLGCGTDWPTCRGQLVPGADATARMWAEWSHRLMASGVLLLGIGVAVEAYRSNQPVAVKNTAYLALFLLLVQAGIGAWAVASELAPAISVAHLAAATAYFGVVSALLVMTYRGGRLVTGTYPAESKETPGETAEAVEDYLSPSLKRVARDYVDLVKPGILFLLLVAGFVAMLLAGQSAPDLGLVGWTMLGGGLAAGSASVFNNVLDRDLDRSMDRTAERPLPDDRVPKAHALVYGATLGAASFLVLQQFVNLASAVFALGGIVFYVVVYTAWLKPSTPQNIVIGGAAGGFPALVGWSAVTGGVGLPAIVLAALVVLWTPPHFWALAIFYKDDYENAEVPMMPVVEGIEHTKTQIVLYSLALVGASLLLWVPLGVLGVVYGASALLLGAGFVGLAVRSWRAEGAAGSYDLFKYSIVYLFLLFVAMGVDRVVAGVV